MLAELAREGLAEGAALLIGSRAGGAVGAVFAATAGRPGGKGGPDRAGAFAAGTADELAKGAAC